MSKADSSLTIRMNREVKQEAQQIFNALGMDMTTAINIFLRQSIQHRGLPFEVVLEENPNQTTLAAMDVAVNETDLYGPFDSVDELMEALNA